MIGFIILGVVSAVLLQPGYAQEYEGRPARAYSRHYDDEELEVAKPVPTVVPILKQINKHNDDGSYTYGFEAADGSFKIETKEANGEVKGKYGYTDANGKLHVVEYGANKYGFQPAGEGITVPPVNFAEEPDELEEELPRRLQAKQPIQAIQPRRPLPVVQQIRPAIQQIRPAIQQIRPWEQEREIVPVDVPAPTSAPIVPRPTPSAPHIIYNAPAPKRPSFFAGAQQISEPASDFIYQAPKKSSIKPQPIRTHTVAYTEAPQAKPQPAYFIPSPQYKQEIQFSQPTIAPKAVRPVENVQYFRPEPAKTRFTQFAELEEFQQPQEVQTYTPRAPAKASRGGFFDQLEEQFQLPSGKAQPIHNVAFGFY